jgi:hypothetical protein
VIDVGLWDLLMGGNSKWDADSKMDKKQHRRDFLGFRTSSRPFHEEQKAKEDARREARKEKSRRDKAAGKFFY